MFQRDVFFTAALCLALLSPAPLLARSTISTHWYQPHYMARVDQAANRLQFLSPHFSPAGQYSSSTQFTLTKFTQSELGVNLFFNESGVKDVPQGLLGLTSISTPYSQDTVTSITYANIEYFEIRSFTSSPTPWCVLPMGKEPGNGIICVSSEETAHQVADALATLAVAYGKNLNMSFSMAMAMMTDKEQRKRPGQTGCLIREVDADGPAEKAGVQENDVVHTVNDIPCSQQAFGAAFAEAISKPQGGVVHAEILRKSGPLTVDLRYPHNDVPAAQLRQQVANPAQQNAAPPSVAPAAAPPASVHFGFQVRPVIQDDLAPLALTKAQGLVVVSVEKGGLADTMEITAGDVILAVNGVEVGDMQQFVQTVRSGAATSFRIWRKGKTLELTVPMSM